MNLTKLPPTFTRLQKFQELIRVLSSVKPENFDLTDWASTPIMEDAFNLITLRDGTESGHLTHKRVNSCGTTACAVGHAGTDPWFNEHGLVMAVQRNELKNDQYVAYPIYCTGPFKTHVGIHAILEFFKISTYTFQYLFVDSSYDVLGPVATSHVIKRLEAVCELIKMSPDQYAEDDCENFDNAETRLEELLS